MGKRLRRGFNVSYALAAAVRFPGTIAVALAGGRHDPRVVIEHPSGRIEVEISLDADGSIRSGSLIRTARRIFEGSIILPRRVLADPFSGSRADAANTHGVRRDLAAGRW